MQVPRPATDGEPIIATRTPVARRAPRRPAARPAVPDARPEKGHGGALAYDWLKRRIVSLELLPGSTVDEAALVDMLGVSRTPLREAIVRLAAEGLIDLLPNRGARVTAMDLTQMQEHLDAFELLQRAATVLAAMHRPDAAVSRLRELGAAFEAAAGARDATLMIDTNWSFHCAIGEACGNRYLARMYTGLLTEGLRIARLAMAYECYGSEAAYAAHLAQILREHRELVRVIADRDAARAASLADSHSNLARKRVSAYLSRNSTRSIAVPGEAGVRLAAAD